MRGKARRLGAALALAGATALASAGREPSHGPAASAGGTAVAPQRLADTGLYLADGSIDPRCRPFVPQYPLWTDGATKSRWIRLPEGAQIDVSDLDAWKFPAGTTLWKEFAWHGRKVETRMLVAGEDGEWTFATYLWSEDQREALLAPSAGVPAAYEIAPGKRHAIPGLADCSACHGSAPSPVLGFGALQLSDDRDPLAPHAEPLPPHALTLRTLVAEDLLAPPRPELVQNPPRIRANDPTERAALGYLSANCGACHNARGPLARLGFVLLHDAAGAPDAPEPARATTAEQTGRFLVPGIPAEESRIVALGAPQRSALLHRMKSRRPASQMPPLGTVIADAEAIELVRRWIADLEAAAAP